MARLVWFRNLDFAIDMMSRKFWSPKGDDSPAPPAPEIAAEKKPAPLVLIVWAIAPRNPHLVIAYRPGQDPLNPMNLVSVLVRSNSLFLRGMELPGPGRALLVTGRGAFTLDGACPRWRGRW
jgi:hypothetical protein